MLRRIFWPKKEKKIAYEGLHALYLSDIIRMAKAKWMRWSVISTHGTEGKFIQSFYGKSWRFKWEGITDMDLKEIDWEDTD